MLLGGRAGEPVEELAGERLLAAGFENDGGLADGWIDVGQENEGADLAKVRRVGDGEGDEAELGVAGLGELRGLADVFGDGEFGLELVVEAELAEGFGGGESVGRVLGVGDGDARDAGTLEGVECEGLGG